LVLQGAGARFVEDTPVLRYDGIKQVKLLADPGQFKEGPAGDEDKPEPCVARTLESL
jgi:hypothetical protein